MARRRKRAPSNYDDLVARVFLAGESLLSEERRDALALAKQTKFPSERRPLMAVVAAAACESYATRRGWGKPAGPEAAHDYMGSWLFKLVVGVSQLVGANMTLIRREEDAEEGWGDLTSRYIEEAVAASRARMAPEVEYDNAERQHWRLAAQDAYAAMVISDSQAGWGDDMGQHLLWQVHTSIRHLVQASYTGEGMYRSPYVDQRALEAYRALRAGPGGCSLVANPRTDWPKDAGDMPKRVIVDRLRIAADIVAERGWPFTPLYLLNAMLEFA